MVQTFLLPDQSHLAESVPFAGMVDVNGLINDIQERVKHIKSQQSMGVSWEEVSEEQAKALLQTYSALGGIDLNVVTAVSEFLTDTKAFSRKQLEGFSACLRAAANKQNRLSQPKYHPHPSRKMQSTHHLEYYLID